MAADWEKVLEDGLAVQLDNPRPRIGEERLFRRFALWLVAEILWFCVARPFFALVKFVDWALNVALPWVLMQLLLAVWWMLWVSWRRKRCLYPIILLLITLLYSQHVWIRTALGEGRSVEVALLEKLRQEEVTARDMRIAEAAAKCSRWTRNFEVPLSGLRTDRDRATLLELLRPGAPQDIQEQTALAFLREAHRAQLGRDETAAMLAVLEVESGFNPLAMPYDRKKGWLSSAAGAWQFIASTAQGYDLEPSERLTLNAGAQGAVRMYVQDLQRRGILEYSAKFVGQDRAAVIFAGYYPYHRNPSQLDAPETLTKIEEGQEFLAKLYPALEMEPFEQNLKSEFDGVVYDKTITTLAIQVHEAYDLARRTVAVLWTRATSDGLSPRGGEDV